MKKILILALLINSTVALAADRDQAARVCDKIPQTWSDSRQCYDNLGSFSYFDNQALSICDNLSFPTSKPKCINAIGDKQYESYQLSSCARENFDDSKLDCLSRYGQNVQQQPAPQNPYYPPQPPPNYPPIYQHSDFDQVYGPAVTRRWQQIASFKVGKVLGNEVSVSVPARFTNEISIGSDGNYLNVESVQVVLRNGEIRDIPYLRGQLAPGQVLRSRLDGRASLAVSEIHISASSPNLIGRRSRVIVSIGTVR